MMPLVAMMNGRAVTPKTLGDAWKTWEHGDLTCVECDAALFGREGDRHIPHFVHHAEGGPCSLRGESDFHREMKTVLMRNRIADGWAAELECVIGARRADVYAAKGDHREVHEIQLDRQPLEKLRARDTDYRAEGITRVVWWFQEVWLREFWEFVHLHGVPPGIKGHVVRDSLLLDCAVKADIAKRKAARENHYARQDRYRSTPEDTKRRENYAKLQALPNMARRFQPREKLEFYCKLRGTDVPPVARRSVYIPIVGDDFDLSLLYEGD